MKKWWRTWSETSTVVLKHAVRAKPVGAWLTVQEIILAIFLNTFWFRISERNDFISSLVKNPKLRPVRIDSKCEWSLEYDIRVIIKTSRLITIGFDICKRNGITFIIIKVTSSHNKSCIVISCYFWNIVHSKYFKLTFGCRETPVGQVLDEREGVVGWNT